MVGLMPIPGHKPVPARWWTGWAAAFVVLAGFYALMVSSWEGKSVTADEGEHLAAGYSYWRFNDYRLNPEQGVLPQRVAGLAVLGDRFPARGGAAWEGADKWVLGREFVYESGNDAAGMLRRGRMACGLMAAAMGALVYGWARRLFGPAGGMISLLALATSPIVLTNGPLTTSDMAVALFFLAALAGFWGMLQRLTPLTLTLSALATAGLFVSKMQAAVFLPVAVAMAVIRVAAAPPLPLGFGRRRLVAGRIARTGLLLGAFLVHAAVTVGVIWACYGFRYEMLDPGTPGRMMEGWETTLDWPVPYSAIRQQGLTRRQGEALNAAMAPAQAQAERIASPRRRADLLTRAYEDFLASGVLTKAQQAPLRRLGGPSLLVRTANLLRQSRLLPEAYVYGHVFIWQHSRQRTAFLNGHISDTGWVAFFPYVFTVKTPLAFLGLLLLGAWGAVSGWRAAQRSGGIPTGKALARGLWATCPLWLFMVVYWPLVLASPINIGHRYLLPVYGPLFVLAGAAAYGLRPPEGARGLWARLRTRPEGILTAGLLVLLAAEMAVVWPNYLPYFNQLVGMPQGYRHLVDSSVDWGQEAPALARFVADRRRRQPERPVYVSYFGTAALDYYGLDATLLPSCPSYNYDKRPAVRVRRGPPGANEAAEDRDYFEAQALEAGPDGQGPGVRYLVRRPRSLRLAGGTYCISATMLQPLLYRRFNGYWHAGYEQVYQAASWMTRLVQDNDEEGLRQALAAREAAQLPILVGQFEDLRLARLCAFLRARRPDTHINYSILVYELSDKDIQAALEGPCPEGAR